MTYRLYTQTKAKLEMLEKELFQREVYDGIFNRNSEKLNTIGSDEKEIGTTGNTEKMSGEGFAANGNTFHGRDNIAYSTEKEKPAYLTTSAMAPAIRQENKTYVTATTAVTPHLNEASDNLPDVNGDAPVLGTYV